VAIIASSMGISEYLILILEFEVLDAMIMERFGLLKVESYARKISVTLFLVNTSNRPYLSI
jgi:hypothetical protein